MSKKLYIETYGCQMNVADSEVVASVMQMAGYEMTDNEEEADAIFLNTCSVRENAENKIYHRLDTLHAKFKIQNSKFKIQDSESEVKIQDSESEVKIQDSESDAIPAPHSPILGVLGCMAERVKDDLVKNHHANLVCGPDSYLNLPEMIAAVDGYKS